MKVFVNYLENYRGTKNTDLLYPAFLKQLSNFEDISIDTNKSILQPLLLKGYTRLKRTRLRRLFRAFPARPVIIPSWQIVHYDVIYNSYLHPYFLGWPGQSTLPPSVLRINYQTDHVLASRSESEAACISSQRMHINQILRKYNGILSTTKLSIPLIEEREPQLRHRLYYCPFFLPNAAPISDSDFDAKLNGSKIQILFVGRDGNRKGIHEFVKSLALLDQKCRKIINVTIVTESDFDDSSLDGIKLQKIKSLANSEVLGLMRESHIFCLPTKSDSYGIVFVEAMSQGCAVLADNDLPRLEFVEGNHAGLCVPPDSVERMAAALERLILDAGFRKDAMKNALKAFKLQFSPEVVARRHVDIFTEVIAKSPSVVR